MKYIGIDLGGTNLRAGIVDEKGLLLEKRIVKTEGDKGPEFVIKRIIETVKSLDGFKDARAVGAGVPAAIDYEKGIIPGVSNLPGWDKVKLKAILEEAFNKKVFLENDANAAGYGEAILGAGRGYNVVQYITISTGVGGGLVIGGRVMRGQSGNASEIGNILIPSKYEFENIKNCNVENLSSGTAIRRLGREKIKVDNAKDVFIKAGEGNKQASDIIDSVLESLARGIANIAHVVEPDIFILGGGVVKSMKPLLGELNMRTRTYMPKRMGERLRIVAGVLEEPGIRGAVLVAIDGLNGHSLEKL